MKIVRFPQYVSKWANQHIKFIPKDGQEVICCGQVNVYEKQGTYQLNLRYIEPKGVGAQALALEQLKEKLKSEGLFDPEKKRTLPFLSRENWCSHLAYRCGYKRHNKGYQPQVLITLKLSFLRRGFRVKVHRRKL